MSPCACFVTLLCVVLRDGQVVFYLWHLNRRSGTSGCLVRGRNQDNMRRVTLFDRDMRQKPMPIGLARKKRPGAN